MCPAFGSLRVGLRMRRTATILSGSACCVYGLTFTSHFYGARRTVGYVPFNSETLVTGKLFEDIREAVHQARRARRSTTPSSSSISACRPPPACRCDLLPKEINGVRIIGIDVPGFGVPTHAEAKDVLAGAMLRYARAGGRAGPGASARAAAGRASRRSRCSARCSRPIRSASARCWSRWAWPLAPQVPSREWRELYAALDCVGGRRRSIRSTRPRSASSTPPAARSSAPAPVGVDGTAAWLEAIGKAAGVARGEDRRRQGPRPCRRSRRRSPRTPIKAPHHLSGYEGSELLVARLLIEAGADVPYVGTACPRTEWSDADREWLEAQGRARPVPRLARAGPRGDARVRSPTWRSAPRRWCRRPRSWASRRSTSPT